MTVHKRMGIERILLPVCLVLLQKLIPVFSLVPSEQWTTLAEDLCIDLQLVQVRTQRKLLRKRKGHCSLSKVVHASFKSRSEKSFWHVTNKQASSQSCCIWGLLPKEGERAERKMSTQQSPSLRASSAIPWCSSSVPCLLEDRAANICTLHGLLHQAAETLITSKN